MQWTGSDDGGGGHGSAAALRNVTPHPPSLPTSHLSSLPLQPLLQPTPFAAAAGAAAASQWSSRAGQGRAGCGPAEPGWMWSGWAGPGRILFATSPQLHRHANRRCRRRPSDAAEEERNPRAGAAPQNKIKFALGLMIVCSRQKKVCSKFNVGLQTMEKVYIDERKVYIQDWKTSKKFTKCLLLCRKSLHFWRKSLHFQEKKFTFLTKKFTSFIRKMQKSLLSANHCKPM